MIFSDELDWVKKNLPLLAYNVIFMDYNEPDYMSDMRMMTFCKYHIIANSTFSWWGAWLAESKKEVLCPQYWLHPDKKIHAEGFDGKWAEFSHVLPESWTKIPNLEEGDRLMS